ncbi:GAF domain-containing protein [uncultured Devosia sp.]|uniref:GAF domain-containing protein n=1 Tax=uncultured Devosia sp. TaxID=211434 RepID=UPI0035CC9622
MIEPVLISDFMASVRRPGTSAAELIGGVGRMVHASIGTKLLTASVFDIGKRQSRRIHSENLAAYPLAGVKPIEDNRWTEIVLRQHRVFSTLRIEDIAEVFFDWRLIQSLGCESNANIPVVVDGKVIGTLNLLHEAGYYTAERLAPVEALLPYATIAFQFLAKVLDADPRP